MGTAYGTMGIVLGLALALYRLRRRYLRSHRSRVRLRSDKIGWPLVVAGLFGVLLGASAALQSPLAQALILTLGAVVLGLAATIDLCCRQYLGAAPLTIYRYLPDGGPNTSLPTLVRVYLRPFMPGGFLVGILALFLATGLLARAFIGSELLSIGVAAGIGLLAFLAWTLAGRLRSRPDLSPEERAFLFVEPDTHTCELQAADRSSGFALDRPAPALPQTILLILNESAGQHLPASEGGGASLAGRIREISGNPAEWLAPSNVVTNSSCTEVSIPSILTGSGAHESAAKLHRMPFVFDLAKASGYRTVLLTSSVLQWSNLDRFLSTARIDQLFSAETDGHPLVNDLGIDDAFAVERFEAMIEKAEGPVFAVVFLNALHVPFQADSRIPIPAHLRDRRSRALSITETAHRRLFEALKRAGRYDGALIATIGDHGELPGNQECATATLPRQENFSDWVLRPLFLLKPPRDLPAPMVDALHENCDRLIANVDIAPTLAHLFGAALRDGLAYTGHSLFEPIPADRIAVATSANQWRPWHEAAVALARGRERLICDRFDFLQYASGERPDPDADAVARASMIDQAMRIPAVSQNISRIYRKHY
jgi:hypothetical protein